MRPSPTCIRCVTLVINNYHVLKINFLFQDLTLGRGSVYFPASVVAANYLRPGPQLASEHRVCST